MLNIGPPTDGHAAVMYEGGGALHSEPGVALSRIVRDVARSASNSFDTRFKCVCFDFEVCCVRFASDLGLN